MKNKADSQSAFLNLRLLVTLFVFLAGIVAAMFGDAFAQQRQTGTGIRFGRICFCRNRRWWSIPQRAADSKISTYKTLSHAAFSPDATALIIQVIPHQ